MFICRVRTVAGRSEFVPLLLSGGSSLIYVLFPRSHSRLQPAAQDPELRGGPRSGPHQREDAPPPRQQAPGGRPLPQQPAGQPRTSGQERHQRAGLDPPPALPPLISLLLPLLPPSSSLASSPPPLYSPFKSRRRSDSHHA